MSQRVNIKYFHKELPQLGTILLFNQVEKGDQVQSYDLKTGENKWSSTSYIWDLDKYKDIANIAIYEIMEGSLGAKGDVCRSPPNKVVSKYDTGSTRKRCFSILNG